MENQITLTAVCTDVGKGESGKPYKYDCLRKDLENMKTISETAMKAIFEIPNQTLVTK